MSNIGSIRPEDILPNGIDTTSINGKVLRKGTVAAFLANVDIFENDTASESQKQNAMSMLIELAPAIITVGLHKHVIFKNSQVEKILIEAESLGQ